jgi:hypothetical protein
MKHLYVLRGGIYVTPRLMNLSCNMSCISCPRGATPLLEFKYASLADYVIYGFCPAISYFVEHLVGIFGELGKLTKKFRR